MLSVVIIFFGNKIGDKSPPEQISPNDSAKVHKIMKFAKNRSFFR